MTNVVVQITADVANALGGFRKVTSAVEAMAGRFLGLNGPLQRVVGRLAQLASIGALAKFTRDAINAADAAGKTAQKIGLTVESLTALQYAADLAGVSVEELETGLRTLSVRIVDAASGSKEVISALEALGVAFRKSDGALRSNEEVLKDLADRFSQMPDGVEKTALAVKLFGRAGQDLIPLLNGGSEGLARMRAEAEAAGAVISGSTAAAAEAFNDNLTRLWTMLQSVFRTIAEALLPTLLEVTEQILQAAHSSGTFGQVLEFVANFVRGLVVALDLVWTVLQTIATGVATYVVGAFEVLGNAIQAVTRLFALWFDNIKAVGEALLSVARRALDVGAIMKEVALGNWSEAWRLAKANVAGVREDLVELGKRVSGNVTEAFRTVVKTAGDSWETVKNLGVSAAEEITNEWSAFWERSLKRFIPTPFPTVARTQSFAPAIGKVAQDRTADLELARIRAERKLVESDPDLLRAQRKRELLPLIAREIELVQQSIVLNEARAADATQDEAARTQAARELIDLNTQRIELLRQEAALMEEGFVGRLKDNLRTLIDEFTAFGEHVADVMVNGIRKSIDTVADGIWAVVDGTATWGQLFGQVARQIISDLIRIVLQWIAGKLLMIAIEKIFGKTVQTTTATEAATAAAAWGPAATLASIASYGAAAGVGLGAMATALGVGTALAAGAGVAAGAAGSALSFAEGGLTPGRPTPAIVGEAGQEFVVTNRGVRNVGVDFLQGINRGLVNAADLATGIPAGIGAAVPEASPGAGGTAAAGRPLTIILVDSRADALRALESAEGEARVVEIVRGSRLEVGVTT